MVAGEAKARGGGVRGKSPGSCRPSAVGLPLSFWVEVWSNWLFPRVRNSCSYLVLVRGRCSQRGWGSSPPGEYRAGGLSAAFLLCLLILLRIFVAPLSLLREAVKDGKGRLLKRCCLGPTETLSCTSWYGEGAPLWVRSADSTGFR